ncbi:hypothetical protein MMP96_09860 [Enterobacter hormaechei]|uniref:hypothetical protein n=1 Tax=Enterobacter hormaechei TaxID=158836 RepID=UPI001F4D507E|nr:hypothetical protein [Enterobacter hormaechei]MCH9329826.1 hypothetical protein [Enterobacter hormaechei]MCH9425678.1 hypothetical protein [Enterobacter hormaechei]
MSSLASWSYTAKATIWRRSGEDEYGDASFAPPEVIMCDYGSTATARLGDIGVELNIKNTFWSEYSEAKKGDYILIGESAEVDPIAAGADEVMQVIRYADTFERVADDYAILTGI